jgi:hypothetical protein
LVAIVTQLAIENGEPLQVDYKDPDWDNLYFDDENPWIATANGVENR